jgi:hypothetical protein
LSLWTRFLRKPREPIAHQLEAPAIEVVDARASPPFVMQQAGALKRLNVPGRRWPCMLEHAGDLAGGHRSALEVQRDQDPPAHRMRERREDRLVRIQPGLGLAAG